MENITTQIESTPKMTAEQLLAALSTPEGQQLLAQAGKLREKIERPNEVPHTEEEIKKFYRMAEYEDTYYFRVDPKTGKPLSEAKHFVWRIISSFPYLTGTTTVRENGIPTGSFRVQFQIQKCHKKEFTLVAKNPKSDPALPLVESDARKVRMPWKSVDANMSLVEAGDRIIDASDFIAQFQKEVQADEE